MVNLDELEALENAATPGPWVSYRMVHADRGNTMTPNELGEYVANSVTKSFTESGSWDFLAVIAEKQGGPADVAHVGNGPTSPDNAKLIELSRNALPALISELRAARNIVAHVRMNPNYANMSAIALIDAYDAATKGDL